MNLENTLLNGEKKESEVPQSCPTLYDPMDCSLRGSSIHGISQARVPEWGAIAFSIPDGTVVKNPLDEAGDTRDSSLISGWEDPLV